MWCAPKRSSPDRHAEPFDHSEFGRRVADREAWDVQTAEDHSVAVLTAVRIAAGEDEFDDLAAQQLRSRWERVTHAFRRRDRSNTHPGANPTGRRMTGMLLPSRGPAARALVRQP
jgi:hypothetical protein